jgi:hypothetical protein
MALHMTKVAYGMSSVPELVAAVERRAQGGRIFMTTRYRPKRHAEIVGGSLYWIIKHQLVARANLIGFEDAEGGRTDIILEARVIPIIPMPRRAHQGWRYLTAEDAPPDLAGGDAGIDQLPGDMIAALAEAGLV